MSGFFEWSEKGIGRRLTCWHGILALAIALYSANAGTPAPQWVGALLWMTAALTLLVVSGWMPRRPRLVYRLPLAQVLAGAVAAGLVLLTTGADNFLESPGMKMLAGILTGWTAWGLFAAPVELVMFLNRREESPSVRFGSKPGTTQARPARLLGLWRNRRGGGRS